MNRRLLAIAAVVAALLALVPQAAGAGLSEPADAGRIPGAWIVTVEPGNSPDRVADDHARNDGAQVDHVFRHALRGYSARMSETAAARIAADPRVRGVVADRTVKATEQTLPTGVDRIDAETNDLARIDGTDERVDVDVAIIDTGIDETHPDLNVVGGVNCSTGKRWSDGNGHGTHVAGTVGALDNSFGVVGVAPGARLWAVRVLNNAGSGSWSSIICGIDWVVGHGGIEVANMSLGGSGSDGLCTDGGMHEAICNAVESGVTFVVAAGNESDDAANHVPAAYDEVITVSALADFDGASGGDGSPTCRTDEDDTFANFSNYGADVDIIAPGVCIASTWKGGGYATISGTSMASPHVAGAAALYAAEHAEASPSQVKSALRSAGNVGWDNADDQDNTKEPLLGVGGGFTPPPAGDAPPVASFTSSCTALDCTFTSTSSDDVAISSWDWTFGDGGSSTSESPSHAFASPGTYSVSLTVTDTNGASDTATTDVTVSSTGTPSAYTATITYSTYGGRFGDKNASVSVHVTDQDGQAVSGATVQLSITNDGRPMSGTSTTDSSGDVTFGVRNAGSNCVVATAVTVDGVAATIVDPTNGSAAC